ncbi:MAG TPA: adenine deaminase C-terminal domain-containing protein, partial [Anaerolineaceae bacterium]
IGDYRELAELIRAGQIDTRMLCFCSDDVSPQLLLEQGSIDARVRLAIRYGLDPVTAIQMATINVADLLRLDRDLGSISPGKIADIAILSDLEKVTVDRVLFEGKLAAQDGRLVQEPPPFEYPDWAKNTIHIQRPVDPADIPIRVDESQAEVSARVIQMGMPKEERVIRLPVRSGSVLPDPEQDVLSVAVLDRHKSSGSIGRGFVTGTGLRGGAVASSVSHDAHNVFTIGADFESMAAAANRLAAIGGGHVAAKAGRVIAEIRLPIAGLISEEPVEVMAEQFERFERLLCEELAVRTPHLLYFIDFLCLPNIPHLGITDQGLINTDTMEIISPVL